jgi:hypothetical protein
MSVDKFVGAEVSVGVGIIVGVGNTNGVLTLVGEGV